LEPEILSDNNLIEIKVLAADIKEMLENLRPIKSQKFFLILLTGFLSVIATVSKKFKKLLLKKPPIVK